MELWKCIFWSKFFTKWIPEQYFIDVKHIHSIEEQLTDMFSWSNHGFTCSLFIGIGPKKRIFTVWRTKPCRSNFVFLPCCRGEVAAQNILYDFKPRRSHIALGTIHFENKHCVKKRNHRRTKTCIDKYNFLIGYHNHPFKKINGS